jgi:hypothetical protein
VNARHALDSADAGAFAKGADDRDLLFGGEYVCHIVIVILKAGACQVFLCYNFSMGIEPSSNGMQKDAKGAGHEGKTNQYANTATTTPDLQTTIPIIAANIEKNQAYTAMPKESRCPDLQPKP